MTPSTPTDDRFIPETGCEPVPGYTLLRLRGRGAFATVWEARSPQGENIAIKVMSSQLVSSTARELRTIQALQRLSHPHMLATRQVWSVRGNILIAMELAEASLLDLFLLYAEEFHQPVEVKKILLYLYQAAEALDYLNARQHTFEGKTVGYQHGDIKPNNILIVNDVAMLADYGMATPMISSTSLTPRQGTLEYAAPEIFQGIITESTDQFSLAVTYYLLRTGLFPFQPVPKMPPRGYQREAPDLTAVGCEESMVLQRALSVVPQSRYPNCVELMTSLLKVHGLEIARNADDKMIIRPYISPPRSQMIRTNETERSG